MVDFISVGIDVALSLIGIFVQYKFRIIQRILKFFTYISNRPVKISLVTTIKSDDDPKSIGIQIANKWKSDGKSVRIITDSKTTYALSNGDYNLDIFKLPEKEIGIKTSNIETPIREVDDKFSEIIGFFEKFQFVSISLTALLPFRYELVEIKTTSGVDIEQYDVKVRNDKWKSEIFLKLQMKKQEIVINSKTQSEMYQVIRGMFKPA